MFARGRLAVVLAALLAATSPASTYHASPTGGGDGRSESSPFQIADFWKQAKPGDVLLLLDGKYTGDRSMIRPPQGLKGAPNKAITVKALHDGRVEIDGENRWKTVLLYQNDYFVLEGLNVHSAGGGRDNATAVELSRSHHNIVRRVCAWDAQDGNAEIFGTHNAEHNLFEDCAGWGIARKIFQNSQGGNYTTYRRCWGRWEGCHAVGPKMTYSCFYNSHHIVLENCIATWDAGKMRETYVLLGYDEQPFVKQGSQRYGSPVTLNHHAVDQPYGVFSADNYNRTMPTDGPYLFGCIAYLLPDQRVSQLGAGLFGIDWGNGRRDGCIENCLAYQHPSIHADVGRPFALFEFRGRNLTAVGGNQPLQFSKSAIAAVYESRDGREIVEKSGHLLATPGGATILYRYENGKLTDRPLWPWPMNQRILDAMKLAGYANPVDVTKTVFELAGGRMPNWAMKGKEQKP